MAELDLFAAVSLSFREAPGAVRMRLGGPMEDGLWSALRAQGVTGALELHTCARHLWLISAPDPSWAAALLQAVVSSGVDGAVTPGLRVGAAAARHALEVSVGLASHLQGEADVGQQLLIAFGQAEAAGRLDGPLQRLRARVRALVRRGLEEGFVTRQRGLGARAVLALDEAKIPLDTVIGVVGAGLIGQAVLSALGRAGRPARLYNRGPRPDALPLQALNEAPPDALIACTAGPEGWLVPPRSTGMVIDLGLPPQVAPGRAHLDLEALLGGEGQALSAGQRQAAEDAVSEAVRGLARDLSRPELDLAALQEALRGFEAHALDEDPDPALAALSPTARRDVDRATRRLLRRLGHHLTTRLARPPRSP